MTASRRERRAAVARAARTTAIRRRLVAALAALGSLVLFWRRRRSRIARTVREESAQAIEVLVWRSTPEEEAAAARTIGLLFLTATGAGLGLLVVYALGGQVQVEGILLGIALGGIGLGLMEWGRTLFPREVVTEPREPHPSEAEEVRAAERSFEEGGEPVARRTFLFRLLLGALAALGLAALFPIRSLGPSPGRSLFRTAWTRGVRVVAEDGSPVRVSELDVGGVITVFPEGHVGDADAAAVVVRVEPELLSLPEGRDDWAPDGNVCYSKVCTHAGCPVGLYSSETRQLQCPCHQSAFDVTLGARPVFGPAARPLPQLPLDVDVNGYLVARGDFPEPVGPGFWNRQAGED